MFLQRALVCGPAYACQLGVRELQRVHCVFSRVGDQDLLARRKKTIEAFPPVTEQRRAAGRRLEKSARRTIAYACHSTTCHIERQPAGTEECPMFLRREVLHKIDIGCPGEIRRVQRTTNQEALLGEPAGWL